MPIFTALAATLGATLAAGAATGAAGAGAAAAAGGVGAATAAATAGSAAVGAGSIAAGLGAVTGLAGAGLQALGMSQQMDAQKKSQALQQTAEANRAQEMNLQTVRATRQAIRQGLVARSVALTNATSQGAGQGSGLQGGYGQISGVMGNNITGISNAQGQGQSMFNINAGLSQAATQGATGQGLSSLGGALVQNQKQIGQFGTYLFS